MGRLNMGSGAGRFAIGAALLVLTIGGSIGASIAAGPTAPHTAPVPAVPPVPKISDASNVRPAVPPAPPAPLAPAMEFTPPKPPHPPAAPAAPTPPHRLSAAARAELLAAVAEARAATREAAAARREALVEAGQARREAALAQQMHGARYREAVQADVRAALVNARASIAAAQGLNEADRRAVLSRIDDALLRVEHHSRPTLQ